MIPASLQALVLGQGEIQIGLWGGDASGKTHLLNASADFARRNDIQLQLYDAAQLAFCAASDFEGFEHCDVLAVDNLDAIAAASDWETRFYQIINRCRAGEFRFLFTLSQPPERLVCELDDFRSRLQWGLLLQLPSSDEQSLRQILRARAELLGLNLSEEVLSYLLNRYERNLASQINLLRQLDAASLSHQRRVTIPLIKQVLPG